MGTLKIRRNGVDIPLGGPAPTLDASGASNNTITIDVSAAVSPLPLTAAQNAANTLTFTGNRTEPLLVLPFAPNSWVVVNASNQNVRITNASSNSTGKRAVVVANDEMRNVAATVATVKRSAAYEAGVLLSEAELEGFSGGSEGGGGGMVQPGSGSGTFQP